MEDNKTIETLEEEVKLLKGEIKQSLASVRDYLLNMELPSSEFATVLAALGGENDTKITLDGGILNKALNSEDKPQEELETGPEDELQQEEEYTQEDEMPQDNEISQQDELEPESQLPEDELEPESNIGQDPFGDEGQPLQEDTEAPLTEEALADEQGENLDETLDEDFETGEEDELFDSEPELLTEEEELMEQVKVSGEEGQSIPKVNLLANLINWVARAKRDIGHDQIPIMLEVYGISGHLSPELKEVILHLAEITQEQPDKVSPAEIWSQTMAALHGVLTGGEAPLYPLKPFWNDPDSQLEDEEEEVDETVVEKTKDMPVKLKLVFPNGDGKGKEFCIDLTPETEDG